MKTLADFCQELQNGFTSCAQDDFQQLNCRVAGHPISVQFAGDKLRSALGSALEHQQEPNLECEWQLFVWDAASGWQLPVPPWSWDDYDPGLAQIRSEDPDYWICFYQDSLLLQLIDWKQKRAFYFTSRLEDLEFWVKAAPFLQIFHHWLGRLGTQVVHSGLIARQDQGILVVGASGSGKSTTCVRAGLNGFDYLADDYCALSQGQGFSLYQTTKLFWTTCQDLGVSERAVNADSGEEKALLYCRDSPFRTRSQVEIRHIVCPRVTSAQKSALEPLSPGKALLALAPSSLLQLRGQGAARLAELRREVEAARCWFLQLGSDPESVVNCLRSLS